MNTSFARSLIVVLTVLVVCSAHASAPDAAAAFRAASLTKYALKRQAFKTGDADLLKNEFYDSDAVVLGDGFAMVGGDAIYEGNKKLLPSRKDIEVVPLRSDVSKDGALAYELTRVQPTAVDPAQKIPEQTILFVWRKGAKGWRVVVEMSVKGAESIPPLP